MVLLNIVAYRCIEDDISEPGPAAYRIKKLCVVVIHLQITARAPAAYGSKEFAAIQPNLGNRRQAFG